MNKQTEKYRLPDIFYTMPTMANATLNSKQLKTLMLETGGKIVAQGSFFDIKKKSLGSGIYSIYLEQRERGLGLNEFNKKSSASAKSDILKLEIKNKKMALDYMVKEFERLSDSSRDNLPEFILDNLK